MTTNIECFISSHRYVSPPVDRSAGKATEFEILVFYMGSQSALRSVRGFRSIYLEYVGNTWVPRYNGSSTTVATRLKV